ncbi:MAG TPA: porin family protein [Longimicrobiales bacterium]|nr:porin family protein [Longimicrobiales bacterium]
MKFCCRILLAAVAAFVFNAPLAAQEIALKGGVAISRFESTGPVQFDGSFVSTAFGGHARFHFGRIAIQPELQMVSRGASASGSTTDDKMRLDYMEVPVMIVVPVAIGSFEPYVFGGPMLSLETRCRLTLERDDLKTTLDCDDGSIENSFDRTVIDYGASAGLGVSHRIGSGRILLEGRYTWGLRDIYDGIDESIEVRNRSAVISIGYAIQADGM